MKLEEAYAILERGDANEWQYVDGLTDGGFQQSVWADTRRSYKWRRIIPVPFTRRIWD